MVEGSNNYFEHGLSCSGAMVRLGMEITGLGFKLWKPLHKEGVRLCTSDPSRHAMVEAL